MEPTFLQTAWFVLFMFLVSGYAVLDGFDLGVGILSLFRKSPDERRIMINAIGPVWDGNEVWLLTGGGALFAAFPIVYATVFSGFYIAMMLLLFALITRAVAMEFRSKVEAEAWRRFWDLAFGISSFLPALLFGVAVGNIMRGIPLDAEWLFTGSFLGLLNPYSVVIGLLSVVMFTCHGALYMAMKGEGRLEEDMKAWASKAWVAWIALWVVATAYSFFETPHLLDGMTSNPLFWVTFLVLLAALIHIPIATKAGNLMRAFLSSSAAIVAMIGITAIGLFPRMVPSSTDLAYSLTIANSSSTERTLTVMLVIALVGMPIVIGYTVFVYRVFKGKVVITPDSY